jgi:hypothetical protein
MMKGLVYRETPHFSAIAGSTMDEAWLVNLVNCVEKPESPK